MNADCNQPFRPKIPESVCVSPGATGHWTHPPGSQNGFNEGFLLREVAVAKGTWPEMLQQERQDSHSWDLCL